MERHHTPSHDSRPKSVHDHERPRHRPSDVSSEEIRRRKSYENGTSGKEDISRVLFKPIRDDLKRVSSVTKENYPSKQERAFELRRLLHKVGDFIQDSLQNAESRSSLESRLW